jgi:hypothetical protein
MKVAQYEVLGWRSERVTRPGRDDRLPACAGEAVRERRGAKRFYRPSGTARVYRSIPGTSYRATFTVSLRDGARFRSIPGTSYRASTVSLRDSL